MNAGTLSKKKGGAAKGSHAWKSRALRLAALETQWIHNESFQAPDAERLILDQEPPAAPRELDQQTWKPVRALPAHLARLCEAPLLRPEEERRLFRRMNYAKYRADQLRRQLDPERPDRCLIVQMQSLLDLARADRDRIVQANLRLVVSLAKKVATPTFPFDLLLSEGIATLLKAVEKLDYDRGYRFSTYATLAVQRSLYRWIKQSHRDHQRFALADEATFQSTPENGSGEVHSERRFRELSHSLAGLLAKLDPRERQIISRRFGLETSGEIPSLQQLAGEFGVCKERIRQLEKRALDRLRAMAGDLHLSPSSTL
jgi:RNA polymerase primary sigma factor